MTRYELPFNPANVHDIDGEFGDIYIPQATIPAQQFHRRLGGEAARLTFNELIDATNQAATEA